MYYIQMSAKRRIWELDSSSKGLMENTGSFLEDVSWNGAFDFLKWLRDDKFAEIESNAMLLIRNGDKMIIGFKYSPDFNAYAAEAQTSALIDLLEQWGTMCDKRDPALIGAYITYDGSKFTVTPEHMSTLQLLQKRVLSPFKKGYSFIVQCRKKIRKSIDTYIFIKAKPMPIIGLHHDLDEDLEKLGIITLSDKKTYPNNMLVRVTLTRESYAKNISRLSQFPSSWSRELVLDKIAECVKAVTKPPILEGGVITIQAFTKDDEPIEIIISLQGDLLSAYPVLQKKMKDVSQ